MGLLAQRDGGIADDFCNVTIEVDHQSGVLVDADDEFIVIEMPFKDLKSTLAEITEPRVVVSTLGIVEMRNHRCADPELAEHVEAFEPIRVHSGFVDLVHGNGSSSEREGCRGGKRDQSAVGEFANQHGTQRSVAPLA